MKKSHFWATDDFLCVFVDFFGWDWGTPALLRQNPKSLFCMVVVLKSWDWVRPRPLIGTKS